MVHIRQGIDPNDHRRGHAPLKGVLREILGDEAAGQWSAALLHNMAVPGVVLSPRNDSLGGPTREEAEAISESYKTKFGGANRGAPMVLSGSMNVDIVSFSPDQMKLQELRRLPEERISAVLGVPAILAGLGAGLDSATYNNTRELREFFTEQKLIPMWKTVSNELSHQLLLKDFKDEESKCEFDYSEVRALQEDMDELYKRVNTGVQGGWITIGEARKVVGLEADEKHDIYLRPLNTVQITEDGKPLLERDRFLEAASYGGKDLLSMEDYPAVNFREPKIVMDEEPRNEEKYVAQMPNGSWCCLDHDTNEVIKCFDTQSEAEAYLENIKKSDDDIIEAGKLEVEVIQELKVSTEEAETLHETESELENESEKNRFQIALENSAKNVKDEEIIKARKQKSLEVKEQILDNIFSKKVSTNVSKILANKVSIHNEANPLFKTNLRTLVAVFNRGHVAYENNEAAVKDANSSADHWGLARVQGFLYALSKGLFKRKPYDVDLLPSSHPLSSNVEKVSRSNS